MNRRNFLKMLYGLPIVPAIFPRGVESAVDEVPHPADYRMAVCVASVGGSAGQHPENLTTRMLYSEDIRERVEYWHRLRSLMRDAAKFAIENRDQVRAEVTHEAQYLSQDSTGKHFFQPESRLRNSPAWSKHWDEVLEESLRRAKAPLKYFKGEKAAAYPPRVTGDPE